MRVHNLVKKAILYYPSLYNTSNPALSRQLVLLTALTRAATYEWSKGELDATPRAKNKQYGSYAPYALHVDRWRFYQTYSLQSILEHWREKLSDCKDDAARLVVFEKMASITDRHLKEILDPQSVQCNSISIHQHISTIDTNSAIMTIPDDVKPGWLNVCQEIADLLTDVFDMAKKDYHHALSLSGYWRQQDAKSAITQALLSEERNKLSQIKERISSLKA